MVGPKFFSLSPPKSYLQNREKTEGKKLKKWAFKNTLKIHPPICWLNFFPFIFSSFVMTFFFLDFFFFVTNVMVFIFYYFFLLFFCLNVASFLFFFLFSDIFWMRSFFFFFLGAHMFIFSLILVGFYFCSFFFL